MSLTERHVRARIDKRTVRCTTMPGRQSVAGRGVQFAPCRGWSIVNSDTAPKLVACATCNALQPERLRVDDRDVRRLPEAVRALSDAQARVTTRRREARYTRHWQEIAIEAEVTARVACGAKIGETPGGRRVHSLTASITFVTCEECLRLSRLEPWERAEERAARSAELRAKFRGKYAEKATARDRIREEAMRRVENARPDASVCLDAFEEVAGDTSRLSQDRRVFLAETLPAAIVAYRLDNPRSRGDRHWVTRTREVHGVRTGEIDVQCRYCREDLLIKRRQGFDYSYETNPHTVPCALRYLAGPLLRRATP